VFITDQNYEPIAAYHFDFSGIAFGSMANPGQGEKLRSHGIIDIEFRRVRCRLSGGQKITFHTEKGSSPNYLALLVKFVADDGDIVKVDLKEKTSDWRPMVHSWGAIWRIDTAKPLKGPFSLRITSESGKVLTANDVIPENWKPLTNYPTNLQFS
jgi:hypothetical protein